MKATSMITWCYRCALILTGMLVLSGCAVFTGSAFQNPDSAKEGFVTAESNVPNKPTATEELDDLKEVVNLSKHGAVESATTIEVKPLQQTVPPMEYRLGPNDVLFISVTGLPELSTPAPRAGGLNAVGSRIDGAGFVQLPLAGSVQVGGLTVRQAQATIERKLKLHVKNPTVVVEVIQFRSKPIYFVGEFNEPGVVYMDRPTTLVQGVALAGGMNVSSAYLRAAKVQRDGQVIPVDIYKLLRQGDMTQNIWLHPYDTVYIPDQIDQRVFVLGDVLEPGRVPMMHGELTLVEAITEAGGFDRDGSQLRRVRIIRPLTPTTGQIIIVDLEKILRGNALDFPLVAGDVVYIPRSDLGNWNDMMNEILPTLRVLSAILDPFVILTAFGN